MRGGEKNKINESYFSRREPAISHHHALLLSIYFYLSGKPQVHPYFLFRHPHPPQGPALAIVRSLSVCLIFGLMLHLGPGSTRLRGFSKNPQGSPDIELASLQFCYFLLLLRCHCCHSVFTKTEIKRAVFPGSRLFSCRRKSPGPFYAGACKAGGEKELGGSRGSRDSVQLQG